MKLILTSFIFLATVSVAIAHPGHASHEVATEITTSILDNAALIIAAVAGLAWAVNKLRKSANN